jgi:Xaa-Pro aminopeptidase
MIPLKQNLVDNIWKRKLNIKSNKFYNLDNKVTGQASESKINALANLLKKKKINTQFITAPENVAWLLNIRGNDSKFSPIPNCYATINRKKNVNLFCNLKKIDKKTKKYLRNVKIIDINNIEKYLSKIKNQKIQIDSATCSIFFISIIKKNNKLLKNYDSIYYLKSIKNKVEIRNTIESHILDGAALTKFLFWVKNNYKRKKISELSAEKKLLDFRKTSKKFKYLSFPTISGSGPNGAIVHYKANKKTNRLLKKGDLYLIDSGGQYNFGTTDVTRTISLDNHKNRI